MIDTKIYKIQMLRRKLDKLKDNQAELKEQGLKTEYFENEEEQNLIKKEIKSLKTHIKSLRNQKKLQEHHKNEGEMVHVINDQLQTTKKLQNEYIPKLPVLKENIEVVNKNKAIADDGFENVHKTFNGPYELTQEQKEKALEQFYSKDPKIVLDEETRRKREKARANFDSLCKD